MNLRDLQYICAVAQFEHFGKAAQSCHVSQPTLSGQIKKLEEELGVKIFERTNKRVMPTDIGQEIILHANNVLREIDSIRETAQRALDPLSGDFRLGAFPTLASYIFPDLVTSIKDTMPKLRLVLLEEKTDILINKLKSGQIDAAFLALPIDDNNLRSAVLFEDEFMLATPPDHPLTQHKEINQSLLDKQSLLLLEEGHCLRDQALDVCQMHNISEDQDFRATSLETLRQMVKAGTGITFMPKIAISKHDIGIHYIPISPPTPSRTIGLVWRSTSARTEIIDKIIDIMKSTHAPQ